MKSLFVLLFLSAGLYAQAQPKAILGSIAGFKPEDAVVMVKPDNTDAVAIKMTPETVFQRVAPGERDLKKAATMNMTDMAIGDRVLVSFKPGTTDASRILIMAANDITKRNEADRLDWNKRGISGVVTSKKDGIITLKMRGMAGETTATVTVDPKTSYRRYSADSVKFQDASISKLDDVNIGDQLRARGVKSEDGSKVEAQEVVFGTFVTKAGTITAVNADSVTMTEIGTNKPLTVKLTADSQIKKMPAMGAMMGGMPGSPMGAGRGGPPSGGPPTGAAPAGGRGPGGPKMPDVSQMLEHMPAVKLDELKPGEKIVVSSTKGAKADEITAIVLLGNADMLIQMATVPAAGGRGAAGGGQGGGMGMGGLQSLDLPSMIMN
jgi:hypothetical protein